MALTRARNASIVPSFSSTQSAAFRFDSGTWDIYLDPAYRDTAIVSKHRMLLLGDRKLIYIPTRAGVIWEMYDPEADPDERRNLVPVEPDRFAAMRERLMQWMLDDPELTRQEDYVVVLSAIGRDGSVTPE